MQRLIANELHSLVERKMVEEGDGRTMMEKRELIPIDDQLELIGLVRELLEKSGITTRLHTFDEQSISLLEKIWPWFEAVETWLISRKFVEKRADTVIIVGDDEPMVTGEWNGEQLDQLWQQIKGVADENGKLIEEKVDVNSERFYDLPTKAKGYIAFLRVKR